jgi:hypothetical protein
MIRFPSSGRALVALLAALLAVLALGGCSTLVGAPASSSSWRSSTDKALGAAVSALGTARTVLENQQRGRLLQPYVDVAMRDLQRTLTTETSSYTSSQPPPARTRDQATAVAAIASTGTLLAEASEAASGSDSAARVHVLDEVRSAYERVTKLQTKLAGS